MTTRAEALAAIKKNYAELTPGQKVTARRFEPADAPGVARLFYQVYGDDYPVDEPYVPELLIEANKTGRIRTFIVTVADGSVVGQAAFYQSSPPNKRFYEYGQMLVDKAYRGTFAVARLHQFAVKNMFGQLEGVDAEFGEAVCHHTTTQKMSRGVKYIECGLELGLMPQTAYAGEGVTGRVSCLLQVRVNAPGQGVLQMPVCWRKQVQALLPRWPLERDEHFSDPACRPPDGSATEMATQHFAFAGVTRLNVSAAGADFADRLKAELAGAKARGHALVQTYLNLGAPWTSNAAEVLRQAGFFFAGFVPLWFGPEGSGPDALLAQRFLSPQVLADIKTQSEEGAAVVAMVLADMARAGREFGSPQAAPAVPVPTEPLQPEPVLPETVQPKTAAPAE